MGRKSKVTEEVRRMLGSVKYANNNIERIGKLIEVIRSRAEKVTTSYSDAPGGSHNPDSRADVIAELVDTERQQEEAIRQWCQAIKEVQVVISWLDDYKQRSILEHKYINCEDWITISFSLNYSLPYLYELHGKALMKLAILLKEHRKT